MKKSPTHFQKSVWKALHHIPKGKVTTYGSLAKKLNTQGVRAVGTAVGKNPDVPATPCHRVVRADGTIGQYSAPGGSAAKIKILKSEGITFNGNKVDKKHLILDL